MDLWVHLNFCIFIFISNQDTMSGKITKTRIFTFFLMAYVLIACTWWTFLLHKKNNENFAVNIALLKQTKIGDNSFNEATFHNTQAYLLIEKKFNSQRRMIIGEAMTFFIILSLGIWLVTKGIRKEVALARQQRNFLLSITHELKSPLAGIKLVLDTFKKRDLKKEQHTKLTSNALDDCDRLNELVNNLLLAAKIENEYNWQLEEINLANVVTNTVDSMKQKHPEVLFTSDMAVDLKPIKADINSIQSVVINLLENAVKYSDSSKEVNVELSQQKNNVMLNIADKGVGIPDQEKNKIFNKFYRIGNEDTRSTKGTGLGLFIVKSIVKAHNGSIFVKNNKPRGTIFQVSFPNS